MSDDDDPAESSHTRRNILIGVAGLGAAGLAGRASAQTTTDDQVGTPENPYLRAHIDRVRFVPRTSDPSSPAEGTLWYRGDL